MGAGMATGMRTWVGPVAETLRRVQQDVGEVEVEETEEDVRAALRQAWGAGADQCPVPADQIARSW